MTTPTPRDVADAIECARLVRELDAIVVDLQVREWNGQMLAALAVCGAAHDAGMGVVLEFSYTDNVIRAFPDPHVTRGHAVLFNLDTGIHHHRTLNVDQIRSTHP